MKKILTTFFALSTLVITSVSCTKDNSSSSSAPTIAGKWYYDTTITTANNSTNPALPYNYSQCTGKKSYLDFQPNGVLAEGDIFQDCSLHTFTDSWTLNGDALNTVLDTGEKVNYVVVSVTATNLVLKNYLDSSKSNYTVYNFTRQ